MMDITKEEAERRAKESGQAVTQKEMPRFKCHKEVWAIQIKHVVDLTEVIFITPVEQGFAPFQVDREYMKKHNPQSGGYYIVYSDGYKSYSPAIPFETGYTRI